ncbi:MAG TPA: acylphosphatase [Methanomicrobiales archaeon]|nr:acylphosphatase [Methanomicrobiales archaeon]
MKTHELYVSGRVQSVGFRACVKKVAGNLGILGEVMNLPDGRVRITATAEEVILEKFVSMLYGCPRAVIRNLEVRERDLVTFTDFAIKRASER